MPIFSSRHPAGERPSPRLNIVLRVSRAELDAVDAEARKRGMSRSDVMRLALARFLLPREGQK